MQNFGIIVGRFQVPVLHEGHKELLRRVCKKHERVIVFLGTTQVGLTRRNPLDFETRKKMLVAHNPDLTVLPLQDKPTDEVWSRFLDARIADAVGSVPAKITLYGSRKSFAPSYNGVGRHKVVELDLEVPEALSATELREKAGRIPLDSEDFRRGMIYAENQHWKHANATVDVAIYHDTGDAVNNIVVLLGRREDEKEWRFVGGHVETGSETYGADARAEAAQEAGKTDLQLTFIGTRKILDWRWRDEHETGCIKTVFYAGKAMDQSARAGDDIFEVKWFPFSEVTEFHFIQEHRVLWHMFQDYILHGTIGE